MDVIHVVSRHEIPDGETELFINQRSGEHVYVLEKGILGYESPGYATKAEAWNAALKRARGLGIERLYYVLTPNSLDS